MRKVTAIPVLPALTGSPDSVSVVLYRLGHVIVDYVGDISCVGVARVWCLQSGRGESVHDVCVSAVMV